MTPTRIATVLGFLLTLTAISTLPSRVGAASTSLVIQEFRTRGPAGGNDEFIELKNVSSGAVSLNNWTIVGSNGSGLQDTRAILQNVTINPGCSYLLGNSNTNGYTGPTDQTYAVGITDDGGIALKDPGGAIVDAVGLTGGSAFGEGGRLGNFGAGNSNRSYERGGDTDNNAADFHLISPSSPQTSGGGCTSTPTPTSPTLTASADPGVLSAGSDVLLTARVTPGTNPVSTGLSVSVNAGAIGLAGNTVLVDTGANGDAAANDGTYSRRVTVAAGTSAGAKVLPATATDAQGRSGSANISLTISAAPVLSTPPTVTSATINPNPLSRYAAAKILVTVVPGTNPTSSGLQVTMNLSAFGGGTATLLSDTGGGGCDATAGDRVFTACVVVPAAISVGPLTLTGTARDGQGRTAPVSISTSVSAPADTDADGLPDPCELAFGLNTLSAVDGGNADDDPDHDGVTNAQECVVGTHPLSFFKRYLAEGVTNEFFQTRLALFNPSSAAVTALVRIQPEGAPERSLMVVVPALQRRTLMPEDIASVTTAPFATVVESTTDLVVDRWMTWGATAYGSHAETAVPSPSTDWYLAEGATGWRFSLFYLLQNPTDQDASVEISYLRIAGEPVLTRTYSVPARQRKTIAVDDEEFPAGSGNKPLGATDVSAAIHSANNVPIVVERSMYMSPDNQPFGAGHAAVGVTAPATTWFFAEGSTGGFFDEFILLANPGDIGAVATLTYAPESGGTVVRTYELGPHSRRTIWVDQEPGLENTALSTTVSSTEPIVAERAMWWPGSGESWREAHVSSGATTTGPKWAVGDVELGGPFLADSYVLVYNGGTLTTYFDDGSAPVVCGAAGAGRVTFHINECPGINGRRFVSVIVNGNTDTVVERATYYSNGGTFDSGGAAMGTRIP